MKKNPPETIKPTQPLTTINPDAAGIDLGSEEIFVCVPFTRRTEFDENLQAAFEQRHKERIIKNLHRKAKQFGFQLVPSQSTVT